MQDDIMVSVIVLTYNHEKYIRQALDSILMQEVDFKYEVLVGDDCSTDGTRKILLEYQEKYPDIFCIRLRQKNIKATKNLYELLMMSNGKYIAYLEGDDFWRNTKKIHEQVCFLEDKCAYIGCAHNCLIVDGKGMPLKNKKYFSDDNFWVFRKEEYTFQDFKEWKLPGQIATWMHRNIFRDTMNDFSIIWDAHNMVADRTLALILLAYGKFIHMDELWSSYRIVDTRDGENWTSVYKNQISGLEDDLNFISNLSEYSNNVFGEKIDSKKMRKEHILQALLELIKIPSFRTAQLFIKLLFAEKSKTSCLWYCIKKIIIKIAIRLEDKCKVGI